MDAQVAWRRSLKTRDRGFDAAVVLLSARGAWALARVLFALEGRWVPLDHWLEREIATLADPTRAGDKLLETLRERRPEALGEGLARLEDRLAAEGVPRMADRTTLFLELIHPGRVEERALHALP